MAIRLQQDNPGKKPVVLQPGLFDDEAIVSIRLGGRKKGAHAAKNPLNSALDEWRESYSDALRWNIGKVVLSARFEEHKQALRLIRARYADRLLKNAENIIELAPSRKEALEKIMADLIWRSEAARSIHDDWKFVSTITERTGIVQKNEELAPDFAARAIETIRKRISYVSRSRRRAQGIVRLLKEGACEDGWLFPSLEQAGRAMLMERDGMRRHNGLPVADAIGAEAGRIRTEIAKLSYLKEMFALLEKGELLQFLDYANISLADKAGRSKIRAAQELLSDRDLKNLRFSISMTPFTIQVSSISPALRQPPSGTPLSCWP